MTLLTLAQLDALELPDAPTPPEGFPDWSHISETAHISLPLRAVVEVHCGALNLLDRYRELLWEAEALRAERDTLVARLNGQPVTAH